jgi:hypothetical protein
MIHITYDRYYYISVCILSNLKIFDSLENEACIYLWTEEVQYVAIQKKQITAYQLFLARNKLGISAPCFFFHAIHQ